MQPSAVNPSATLDLIQRELAVLVRRALRGTVLQAEGQQHQLDLAAYSLLVRLADDGPQRSGDLARAFGVDKSTMSRKVSALERAGLVTRTEDALDRRAYQVTISPHGRRSLDRTRADRRRIYRDLLDHWSETDREAFARLLARFNADMSAVGALPGRPRQGTG
jgi:DNA-binding MarR family transcriptional regulator